jgi:predicted tellurium resistance membrane protein TerC
LAIGCWLLAVGYWLLAVGYWLLAIGCWLLAVGYWLLAVGYWLLAVGCWYWLLAIDFQANAFIIETGQRPHIKNTRSYKPNVNWNRLKAKSQKLKAKS